jgi:hypothetical protein
MSNRKIKFITLAVLVLASFMFTGCIPPNEHVGKPAAHNYKDSYYGYGSYYDRGYYYYR